MSETSSDTRNESYTERLRQTVADIFLHNPNDQELADINHAKKEIIDPLDKAGVGLFERLRASLDGLETDEGWHSRREAARAELTQLPPDFLEQILERFKAFEKNLPAGHSRGHMLRDSVNLAGMLRDPAFEAEPIDEVELLVGITAGMFHDIGNSVVDRYEDVHRAGAHAEVSAELFGRVAEGIVPPNLILLTQYAIAAHTHYTKPMPIKLSVEEEYIKGTYQDEVTDGIRRAVWIARQSDRRDLANFAQLVRDMIVRTKPAQDFDGDKHYNLLSPEDNFRYSFDLSLSPEERKGINSVLDHEAVFARSVFSNNPYTVHDTDFFTHQLMEPGVGDFLLLLSVIDPNKKDQILSDIEQNDAEAVARLKQMLGGYESSVGQFVNKAVSPDDISEAINSFKQMLRAIEPAPDLEERLDLFQKHFVELLSPEDQANWAKGILFMKEVLMHRWMSRLVQSASGDLRLGDKITSQDPAVRKQFDTLGHHLQVTAEQIVEVMSSQPA